MTPELACAFFGLASVLNWLGTTAAKVADWWTAPGDDAGDDTSPHALSSLVDAEQAEYAAAAHDDDLDDLDDPEFRDIVDALRMIPTHAEDGCWMADHVLGVHSPADERLRTRGDA